MEKAKKTGKENMRKEKQVIHFKKGKKAEGDRYLARRERKTEGGGGKKDKETE